MKFEVWKSNANQQWYWRMVATNGKSIAVGGEGYHHRADCAAALMLVRQHASTAIAYEQKPDGTWFQPA